MKASSDWCVHMLSEFIKTTTFSLIYDIRYHHYDYVSITTTLASYQKIKVKGDLPEGDPRDDNQKDTRPVHLYKS